MAKWSDLKAAIANIIKTNGNQEITGAVLQNVLNNIISNVGENASFVGVATPSTNPGTPDGNVFYFASEAGIYSNFGGLELEKGLSVIIYNGSKWAAISLDVGSKDDYINILNIISANNIALKYDSENVQLYPILSVDGLYNFTDSAIDTQGTYPTNYHALYYDVSGFDYLTIIGTVTGSVSTTSDKRPSISIVYKDKPLYYLNASNSDIETTIDLSKVSDKKGMVAIVNGVKAKDVIVKGKSIGFITKAENARLSTMKFLKGCNETIKEDKIEAGRWDYTNNILQTSSASVSTNNVYHFNNIAFYDRLIVNGAADGLRYTNSSAIVPSLSLYDGDSKVDYKQITTTDDAEIDLTPYKAHLNLRAIILCAKANTITLKGISTGIANSIDDIDERVSNSTNSIDSINVRINGVDENIFPELFNNLLNGWWIIDTDHPNGHLVNYSSTQRSKCTDKIDITYYESVTLKGLFNGVPLSNTTRQYEACAIYGDGNYIGHIRNISTEASNIFLSDYSQYSKVEIVLNIKLNTSLDGPEFDDNTVRVYSTGITNSIDDIDERVSNSTNSIDSINVRINGVDENIFPELFNNLLNGWWIIDTDHPNGHLVNYSSTQRSKCTDKIDITYYESVTLKGLFNGVPLSNTTRQYEACAIYGDGNYIGHIRNISTEASNIFLSDYSQYSKVEIVLNIKLNTSLDGPEFNDNIVRVYSTGITKEAVTKRLVICGDSLCGNTSGLLVKEFNSILSAQGYDPIIARNMGGENIIGNLTRAGGLGIRVKSPFTIPASGSVECALESQWILASGGYAQTPYNSLPNGGTKVTICGILGTLEKASTNAVGVAFYTSEQAFISSLSDNGTYDIPSNAAYYRFTINNPQTGEAHITINDSAVDITEQAILSGYVNNSGAYVSSNSYKCSDYISILQGTIYIDSLATSTGYKFTRNESGESVKVGVGEVFFDNAFYDDRDYPHIWFTGQNGGYTDEQEWAQMVKAAAYNFNDKYIVCSTALTKTTDELVRVANILFNGRYLNLRAYTQGQAVYDGQALGIIEGQYTASDYETLFWPGSDKVHQNNLLSYIWAAKMWNTLLELGYVEGERIETGDYYLP